MFEKLLDTLSGDDEPKSDLENGIFVVPEDAGDDWNPGYEPANGDDPGVFDEHGFATDEEVKNYG